MRALRLCPRPKGSGSAVHPVGCVTTTFPANHHGCFPECTDPSKPGAPKMQSQKTLSLIWPPDFIWLVLSRFFNYFPFSHFLIQNSRLFLVFYHQPPPTPRWSVVFYSPRGSKKRNVIDGSSAALNDGPPWCCTSPCAAPQAPAPPPCSACRRCPAASCRRPVKPLSNWKLNLCIYI